MKLKSLIPEAIKPVDLTDYQIGVLKDYTELIKQLSSATKTCSEAMKIAHTQKKALIRASARSGFGSFLKPRGTKRKPIDTNANVDEFFEKFRKKNYPKVPSRQNSAFAYCVKIEDDWKPTVPMPAMMYGSNSFFVLAKNGTPYFQTNNVKYQDFTESTLNTDIENYTSALQRVGSDTAVMKRTLELLGKHLNEYLSNSNSKLKDLKVTDAEVVFTHKGYQTINAKRVEELCSSLQIPQPQMFHVPTIKKLEKLI